MLTSKKSTDNNPTTFVWEGTDIVQETAPDGTVTHYNWANGTMVSFTRGGETYTLHSDTALGHVTSVTDSEGHTVFSASYDAWGNQVNVTDNVPGSMSYRYVGALGVQWMPELGIYYMRHRFYDAGLQQFISPDPLKSNPDLYEYANDDPAHEIDPTGLAPSHSPSPTPELKDLKSVQVAPGVTAITGRVAGTVASYYTLKIDPKKVSVNAEVFGCKDYNKGTWDQKGILGIDQIPSNGLIAALNGPFFNSKTDGDGHPLGIQIYQGTDGKTHYYPPRENAVKNNPEFAFVNYPRYGIGMTKNGTLFIQQAKGANGRGIDARTLQRASWNQIKWFMGGSGLLLSKGGTVTDSTLQDLHLTDTASRKQRFSRTAVGIDNSGNLILTVAGYHEDSRDLPFVGVTLDELATIMKHFGAVNAIFNDGGGSTDMRIRTGRQNKLQPSSSTGQDGTYFYPFHYNYHRPESMFLVVRSKN